MERNSPYSKQIKSIVDKFDFDKTNENFEISEVKKLPKEKRVAKLIEIGVLKDLEGYTWGCLGGDRFYVFADIKGTPVPMYRTSARTDGKRKDINFFPFFGIQNKGWLIKGNIEQDINTFYGVPELEEKAKILTQVFDFDTDRGKNKEKENKNSKILSTWDKFIDIEFVDNYIPEGNEIQDAEKLNELLSRRFDIDFTKVNEMPHKSSEAVKYISEKIFEHIKNN